MKVGIFGGAFNPPHIGHVKAAKTAIYENKLDLLLVIPTGTPPHKTMPEGTPPPQIRLQMTKNAFDGIDCISVSDMEVLSDKNNYTIDTVYKIKTIYPDADLFLLVGNDMYDSLDTWKESKELLELVTPVLLPRDVTPVSSTEVRNLLPERKGQELISSLNYSLIIKHRYYNAKPNWDWLREKAYLMLEKERIAHVKACETAATELSERWDVDKDDAREAAILHDITKKLDFNDNICIILNGGLEVKKYNKKSAKLLHSISAAILAKEDFGVSDTVADAIKAHTTGSAGMSMLDKIIYIADYIESTRDFPGVEQMRQMAFNDINRALIMGLEMVVNDLKSRNITPDEATYNALSDLGVKQ